MSVQIEDLDLLDVVRNFALDHPDPAVERFKPSMRDWGDTRQAGDLRQQSQFGD